jgi:tetratricopeptide (TPR) repeat protein
VRYLYSFLCVVLIVFVGICGSNSQTAPPKTVDVDAEMARIHERLKVKPNSSDLHGQLAALASAKSDWQTFDNEIALAIKLDPTRVTNYFGAAEVYRRRGLPEKASEMLNSALAVDTLNPLSHFFMGAFYEHLGDREKAKSEFEQTRQLLVRLRKPGSEAKNRIHGDNYYDSYGNPYLIDHLDERAEKHLAQINAVQQR